MPAGEPVGCIIQLENGFKIYHMGDTGLFGDMKFIGDYYKPDLVLVPIGGHFVLDPKDAAYAMKELVKPKMAMADALRLQPHAQGHAGRVQGGDGPDVDPDHRHEPGRQEAVLAFVQERRTRSWRPAISRRRTENVQGSALNDRA